jgi:hypothetical protein
MYSAILVSSLFFVIPWALMLARDINALERRSVFNLRVLGWTMVPGFVVVASVPLWLPVSAGPASTIRGLGMTARFLLAVAVVAEDVILAALIYRHAARATGSRSSMLVAIALSICWFVSLVVSQRRLNTLVDKPHGLLRNS